MFYIKLEYSAPKAKKSTKYHNHTSSLDSGIGFASAQQPTSLDSSLHVGGAISNHRTKLLCTKFKKSATNSKKCFHFSTKTQKDAILNLTTIGQILAVLIELHVMYSKINGVFLNQKLIYFNGWFILAFGLAYPGEQVFKYILGLKWNSWLRLFNETIFLFLATCGLKKSKMRIFWSISV